MGLQKRLTDNLNRDLSSIGQESQVRHRLCETVSQENRYLLEALPNIAWIADSSGTILYINQQWSNFTRLLTSDSLADNFWDAIHPADRAVVQQKWDEAIATGKKYAMVYRLRSGDGSYCWFTAQAQPIATTEGVPAKWLGTCTRSEPHDSISQAMWQIMAADKTLLETRLQQMQDLLERRNGEIEEFIYLASHDLKAPLRAISNLAQWLAEDSIEFLPEENQHQLKVLRSRIAKMDLMLEALLEYSRLDKMSQKRELVDLSALITEIVVSLDLPPNFSVSLAANVPVLLTKKAPLERVLKHLIDNAVRHHPRYDGSVSISVTEKENFYEFTVADDGMGIDPKESDRVFKPFQTISAKSNKETAGMGLAIVKKIVENEGCKIKVSSPPEGGSAFQFTWLK